MSLALMRLFRDLLLRRHHTDLNQLFLVHEPSAHEVISRLYRPNTGTGV